MKIAIVGAGWAGLSAAVRLKQSGHEISVFESSDTPGGRARRIFDPQLGKIDNGQHLMLGAYTETLALIQMLHQDLPPDQLLRRSALRLESLDGQFCMRAWSLPSPLNLLTGVLFAKGLSLVDKWRALLMLARLKQNGWICEQALTVDQLLKQHRQTPPSCRWLWHPLCISAMNTPVAEASAQVFLNVLKDSFDASADHSEMIIPRVDLSALWPDAATTGLDMRWRHVVRCVQPGENSINVDGETFDYVILATPPYAASRMLASPRPSTSSHNTSEDIDVDDATLHPTLTDDSHAIAATRETLDRFTYYPITNITIGLTEPWEVHGKMWMLEAQVSKGQVGQWLFVSENGKSLSVVISTPDEHVLKMSHETLAILAYEQVKAQCSPSRSSACCHNSRKDSRVGSHLPQMAHYRVVTEKRATFACTVGLNRPPNQTLWPRLLFAGDWTHSPYSAVLEAAVRSGRRAAESILTNTPRPPSRS